MRRLVDSASQYASSAVCHVNASGPYLRLALTEKWRVTKSSSIRAADHFRALRLECPTDLFCKEGPVINYFTRHGRNVALGTRTRPASNYRARFMLAPQGDSSWLRIGAQRSSDWVTS